MNTETTHTAGTQAEAKRTAKDSVFCDLFRIPKYLLQLYQALHPEDTKTTEAEIDTVTIRNILLDQMYNDLGFTVGTEQPKLLILLEAQATWTLNIIVRILMYLINTWKEYIESQKLNVYGSRKIPLPKPELYVIYTGERHIDREWISLAEDFFPGENVFVDARVRVLYDGAEGDIINQYVTFTKVYNEQVRQYGRTRTAVLHTIRICKDRDVLKEYLQSREKEVVDIMMTLFDQEYAIERYTDEIRRECILEAKRECKQEGILEGKKEAAFNMRKDGFSDSTIARLLAVNISIVQQWFEDETTIPQ